MKDKVLSLCSLLTFGAFLGYFAMTFRRYQVAVSQHQRLTEIMNDPTIRVAHGDTAKEILKIGNSSDKTEDLSVIQKDQELQVKAD
jgi:hypothetical protein